MGIENGPRWMYLLSTPYFCPPFSNVQSPGFLPLLATRTESLNAPMSFLMTLSSRCTSVFGALAI